MSRGSIREVRRLAQSTSGYDAIRKRVSGRDWEIVGFDDRSIVLRIERENLQFDRKRGVVTGRFKL